MNLYVVTDMYAGDAVAVFSTMDKAEAFIAVENDNSLITLVATVDGGKWDMQRI